MTAALADARRRLAIVFGGFVALGLAGATFGAAWPEMRRSFGQSVSALAWIGVATTVTYALGASLGGALTGRIGAARVFVIAGAIGALAMIGVSITGRWLLVPALAAVSGLGTGLLDASGNAYVATRHGVRAMGVLHASFGVGSVLSPLILGFALRAGISWRIAFVVTGVLFAALALTVLVHRSGWDTGTARAGEVDTTNDVPPSDHPMVALGIAMFSVYVAFELAIPVWASSLLTDLRHASPATASWWVAGFWATFTLVRILLGPITARLGERRLLDGSMAVAVLGGVIFWLVPTSVGAGVGMLLAGAGQSAFFPMHISLTVHRVGTARAATVIGRQVTAASAGFLAANAAVGWLVHSFGLGALGPTVVVLGLATAAIDHVVRSEALGH